MLKSFLLIQEEIAEVESEIMKYVASDVALIPEIGTHIFSSGGKRLRPALLILSAKLFQPESRAYIPLAGVIELIHTATLLHDDVVDRAESRRGVKSVNTVWGNEAGILAGDFLFAQAFSILVSVGNLEILKIIADTVKIMSEGELFQIGLRHKFDIAEEEYIHQIHSKTAVLISSACRIGALIGKASREDIQSMGLFGEELGIAFQLIDDVFDYSKNTEDIGKPVGIDFIEQKVTLPLLFTLKQLNAENREKAKAIFDDPSRRHAEFEYIRDLVLKNGGIEFSLSRARHFSEKAKDHIKNFKDSEEKEALLEIADYVIERNK